MCISMKPYGLHSEAGIHVSSRNSRRAAGIWPNGVYCVYTAQGRTRGHWKRYHNQAHAISIAHRWCQGYDV